MLAIFGFRKNRSQTSGQGSDCSAEFYGEVGHVVATATMGFVYRTYRHNVSKNNLKKNTTVTRPNY